MGAAAANRLAAEILVEEGRACGVSVRDRAPESTASDRTGAAGRAAEAGRASEWEIRASVVVNATGPWTDETAQRSGISREPLLRPTRGTHIHVRRDRIGHQRALIFESALDGRIMFVLPWGDLTLIGTTDEDYEGPPEEVRPTGADVLYLLDSTNRLFPEAKLTAEDVISAWAGLRPLVAGEPGEDEDEVSREHVILEELPGLLTIAGGKLTSHRAMAEEAIDRAVESLVEEGAGEPAPSATADRPLPGGDFESFEDLLESLEERAAAIGLDPSVLPPMAETYGAHAEQVLDLATDRPDLRERVVADRPNIAAEILYSVREEMPVHVEDVAFRRTRLALETEDFAAAVARMAAIMGEELEWDAIREEMEVERAGAVRQRNEIFRAELGEGDA
jgi:glycerol-3-phosphate dehydrogenase